MRQTKERVATGRLFVNHAARCVISNGEAHPDGMRSAQRAFHEIADAEDCHGEPGEIRAALLDGSRQAAIERVENKKAVLRFSFLCEPDGSSRHGLSRVPRCFECRSPLRLGTYVEAEGIL